MKTPKGHEAKAHAEFASDLQKEIRARLKEMRAILGRRNSSNEPEDKARLTELQQELDGLKAAAQRVADAVDSETLVAA